MLDEASFFPLTLKKGAYS